MIARPLLAAMVGASVAAQPPSEALVADTTGTICAVAIFHAMDEIGRRCFPGEDPAVQAALGAAAGRLDAHVVAKGAMSREENVAFGRQMSSRDEPTAQLCSGDGPSMYRQVRSYGAEAIAAETDRLIARSEMPEWGSCL